jgi:ABC-type multidrug transport system permease subunit
MMNHPLVQLVLCRIREFFREPAAIFWVYGFPLLLALFLGIAFKSRPVEKIRMDLAITSEADRPAAEAFIAKWVEQDPRLILEIHSEATARDRLRTNKTPLVLLPDPHSPTKLRYLIDENRPESVLARAAADNVILRGGTQSLAVPVAEQMSDDSGARYIDFLIPGLVGMNLMGGGLFGVGFLIVDLRVRKLLKRFLATPMKKSDFLWSLVISRLLFTVTDIAILLTASYFMFGVKVHGNLLALMALVFLGGTCFGGVGLLIACRAKTLETGAGLMNAFMLPQWVVSGVFFSADHFPAVVQPLIQALPLTALINGLRTTINDGGGFAAIWWPTVILVVWGGLSFILALKLFRWR